MKPHVLFCPDGIFHSNGHSHPESPERLQSLSNLFFRLQSRGTISMSSVFAGKDLTPYNGPHLRSYLDMLASIDNPPESPRRLDPDTGFSTTTMTSILSTAATLELLLSSYQSGGGCFFLAERPPGHHALSDRAMGFCIVNHVATLAWHILRTNPESRVAILDFDVHHGNGTEAILRSQDRLLFISTHQYPFYPGTGSGRENTIRKKGEGILDIPLAEGTDDQQYRTVLNELVFPRLEQFRPSVLIVSAGFDAHRDDPLGGLLLTEETYHDIGRRLLTLECPFIASVLEGGYNLSALSSSTEAYLQGLNGPDVSPTHF
ncbi:MAG: histone deacetylase family protein [Leptospirales bacterium]